MLNTSSLNAKKLFLKCKILKDTQEFFLTNEGLYNQGLQSDQNGVSDLSIGDHNGNKDFPCPIFNFF